MTAKLDPRDIEVVAPNLKKRLSGVTSTIARLVPLQARNINIVSTGPGLPAGVPHISLFRALTLPNNRWRVWHARRNNEMLVGLMARYMLGRKFRLVFTSAAQRDHTRLTKWLIGKMDAVIATSEKSASYLKVPSTVIMHGIDLKEFFPAENRVSVRNELGLPSGLLIGCFGRIRRQKGIDVLLGAAIQLFQKYDDMHVVLLGRVTPNQEQFWEQQRQKVDEAGYGDRLVYRGEIPWEDVIRHYQALDLYVGASRVEGLGLTPIEAMASGVPAVVTTAGTFDLQVKEPETGAIVPTGDVGAMMGAIDKMLSDPVSLRAKGKIARSHVEENFDIGGEATKLNALYRDILRVP